MQACPTGTGPPSDGAPESPGPEVPNPEEGGPSGAECHFCLDFPLPLPAPPPPWRQTFSWAPCLGEPQFEQTCFRPCMQGVAHLPWLKFAQTSMERAWAL